MVPTAEGLGLYPLDLLPARSVWSLLLAPSLRCSNYGGTTVQLAAPGTNILSTWFSREYAGQFYAIRTGTSMAAPYVSGAAALAMAASGGHLTNKQVRLGALLVLELVPLLMRGLCWVPAAGQPGLPCGGRLLHRHIRTWRHHSAVLPASLCSPSRATTRPAVLSSPPSLCAECRWQSCW